MKAYIQKALLAGVLALCAAPAAAQDNKKLPEGMTEEMAAKISAMLPEGVTLDIFMANLPQGMSLEQALKMMAQQNQAKEAAAAGKEDNGMRNFNFIPFAAINLGMTTSLGVPTETRSIENAPYNFNFSVGFYVSQMLSRKWGVRTGLAVDRKGGNSNVIMKDYFTKVHINNAPEETQGYFCGRSENWHDVYYLTIPVMAMVRPNSKWEFHFGPYFSYAFSRDRHGKSSEGTIRESLLDPVGPVDNSWTDFTDKVHRFDFGVQGGLTRQVWRRLYLVTDLSWGLVNVWDGRDYGMEKNIFNIYGRIGFGWRL